MFMTQILEVSYVCVRILFSVTDPEHIINIMEMAINWLAQPLLIIRGLFCSMIYLPLDIAFL